MQLMQKNNLPRFVVLQDRKCYPLAQGKVSEALHLAGIPPEQVRVVVQYGQQTHTPTIPELARHDINRPLCLYTSPDDFRWLGSTRMRGMSRAVLCGH